MSLSSINIILLIFTILLLVGLCIPSIKKTELFSNPLKSTEESVESGSSELYNWGYNEIHDKKKSKKPTKVKKQYVDVYDDNDDTPVCVEDDKCDKPEICRKCDIALNKDINRYVLKSSVPPCPDMSNYIEKKNLPAYPNMDKYILKSKVPACKTPDMDDYILKSKIPPCAPCRECPSCEECPAVPDMDNYVRRDDLDKICRNRGGNGEPVDNKDSGGWFNLPKFRWPSWLNWGSGSIIDDESQPTDNPILPQSGSDAAGGSASDTSAGNSASLGDTSGSFNSIVDGESADVQEGFGNMRAVTNKIAFGRMAGSGCDSINCGNYGQFGI